MRSERIILLASLALLPACARTLTQGSAVDQHATDDAAFWSAIEDDRTLTNHDALHGLFLLADGADPNATYEDRVQAARNRNWIPPGAPNPVANESTTVGRVASVAAQIAEVKGGLSMRLSGPTPRYATRELIYLGLLPDRTENQSMSGLEFIDLMGRLEDHMASERTLEDRLRHAEEPATEPGPEPAPEPAEPIGEESGTTEPPATNQETPPQRA